MKELGLRTEQVVNGSFVSITIVELTDYELAILKEVLEQRDLSQEVKDLKAWWEKFREDLGRAVSNNPVSYPVIRHAYRPENRKDFSAPDGELYSFEAWAKAVLQNYHDYGRTFYVYHPVLSYRNFGLKSRQKLIAALQAHFELG